MFQVTHLTGDSIWGELMTSGKNHRLQCTWRQSRASQAPAGQRSITPYKWAMDQNGRAILTVPSSLVRHTSKRSQLRGLFLCLNKSGPSASVPNVNMFISVFDPCSYAVVLFTDLSLENNLVNGEKSLVSSTSFSLFVVLNGDPGTTRICGSFHCNCE